MSDENAIVELHANKSSTSCKYKIFLKKFFAEVIGTSCITYIACGTLAIYKDNILPEFKISITDDQIYLTKYENENPKEVIDYFQIITSFGLTFIVMFYSIGNISGCHINPAVSLAMFIMEKIDLITFLIYIGGQILGAIIGTVLLGLCFRHKYKNLGSVFIQQILYYKYNKNTKIGENIDGWSYFSAFFLEIFLSFIFVLTICGVTDNKKHYKKIAGFVIGFCLILVMSVNGNFTGSCVNPASALSTAIFEIIHGDKEAIKQVWIFVLGPLVGGACAGCLYDLLTKLRKL